VAEVVRGIPKTKEENPMPHTLNRRDFLIVSGSAASLALASNVSQGASTDTLADIFPKQPRCRSLLACDVRRYSLDERILLFTLQGLVNRERPQLYLISTGDCEHWLDYYKERLGVSHQFSRSPYELLDTYRDRIAGYRIYDPDNLHTINLAITMAGLDHALPVHPVDEDEYRRLGLERKDDLRGRFKDRYDAYRWGLENLQSKCSQRVVANLCMDWPHWPSESIEAIDFFVKLGAFQLDCSSAWGHPRDVAILRDLYERMEKPGCVLGWHCARDHEHEAVGLAADYGLFALCNLRSPNYSIHPSIGPEGEPAYSQALDEERLARAKKVEPKVYLANLQTDGDAAWAMTNRYNAKWLDPERGQFPMSWSLMPSVYHLGPGLLEYYHETRTDNDCLICGPSGVLYTYPHRHPDPMPFLRMTRKAMNRCATNVMNVNAWNLPIAYRGVHPNAFFDLMRKELPDALGFVRGMGESAFEPSILDEKAPIVYCGEAVHYFDNPYHLLKDFADACPNRPLFIFCYVNHNITLWQMLDGYLRWPKEFEVLRLDEFMIKLRSAIGQGIIKDDLYPKKEGVREILKADTRVEWDKTLTDVLDLGDLAIATRGECLNHFDEERIGGCDEPDLEAAYQFELCQKTAMMVRRACNGRGIYVGNRRKGLEDFLCLYRNVPDPDVLIRISDWWHTWPEEGTRPLKELQRATIRAVRVAKWLQKVNDGWGEL